MKIEISPRDLELLSAYLDGELDQKETVRIEARLKVENDLNSTLQSLALSRDMVRSLPRLKAPRNFTLTAEMAGVQRKKTWLFSTLRLSSAFASLLLILVLMGDFLTGASGIPVPGLTSLMAGAPQDTESMQLAMESSVEAETMKAAVPESVAESQQPGERSMAGTEDVAEDSGMDFASEETPQAMGEAAAQAHPQPVTGDPPPSGELTQPSEQTLTPEADHEFSIFPLPTSEAGTVDQTESPASEPAPQLELQAIETPTEDVQLQEDQVEVEVQDEETPSDAVKQDANARIWRSVEIMLALAAVGTALGAWLIRRTAS